MRREVEDGAPAEQMRLFVFISAPRRAGILGGELERVGQGIGAAADLHRHRSSRLRRVKGAGGVARPLQRRERAARVAAVRILAPGRDEQIRRETRDARRQDANQPELFHACSCAKVKRPEAFGIRVMESQAGEPQSSTTKPGRPAKSRVLSVAKISPCRHAVAAIIKSSTGRGVPCRRMLTVRLAKVSATVSSNGRTGYWFSSSFRKRCQYLGDSRSRSPCRISARQIADVHSASSRTALQRSSTPGSEWSLIGCDNTDVSSKCESAMVNPGSETPNVPVNVRLARSPASRRFHQHRSQSHRMPCVP